jgi:hypothetical protein
MEGVTLELKSIPANYVLAKTCGLRGCPRFNPKRTSTLANGTFERSWRKGKVVLVFLTTGCDA